MRSSLHVFTATLLIAPALAAPPVFQPLDFETALQRAQSQDKILIVDATAEWCGPCKNMDRTTWVDPSLVRQLEQHAIAIQFDVDEHPELAEQLRATALPTIIAFKAGEETDRLVGYKSASEMKAWLENVRAGISTIDLLRDKALAKDWRGRYDIDARLDYASALYHAGELEEATEQYAWLWDNMLEHDPAKSGVRRSFTANEIRQLAEAHAPARERFTEIRDRTQAALEQSPDWDLLMDWIVLNDIIDDPDATLAWVDRILAQEGGMATLERLGFMIDDLLIDQGRYDLTWLLLDDPLADLQREHDMAMRNSVVVTLVDDQARETLIANRLQRFRYRAAVLHAAALAAGDHNAAGKLLERILLLEDSIPMRTQLVRHAESAGVLNDRLRALLYPDTVDEHAELLVEIDEQPED